MDVAAANTEKTDNAQAAEKRRSAFARAFERAVGRARLFGYAERLWERGSLTVGGLTATFLTASWFGAWQYAPAPVRIVGAAMFAFALAVAAAPLLRVKYPTRDEALARMDKANNGGRDRTATSYNDLPVSIGTDGSEAAFANMQKERIQEKVGSFKAGTPQSNLPKRDLFGLRFVPLILLPIAFAAANGQHIERIAAIADWNIGPMLGTPAKVDAWVAPPAYTNEGAFYLTGGRDNVAAVSGSTHNVLEGSVLTVRVQEPNPKITVTGNTAPVEDACRVSRRVTECKFPLAGDVTVTVDRRLGEDLTWTFNVTPDLPPRLVITPGEAGTQLNYTLEDEREGAAVTEGRIRPIVPGGNGPQINIPLK